MEPVTRPACPGSLCASSEMDTAESHHSSMSSVRLGIPLLSTHMHAAPSTFCIAGSPLSTVLNGCCCLLALQRSIQYCILTTQCPDMAFSELRTSCISSVNMATSLCEHSRECLAYKHHSLGTIASLLVSAYCMVQPARQQHWLCGGEQGSCSPGLPFYPTPLRTGCK